jgi:hypothetical protein
MSSSYGISQHIFVTPFKESYHDLFRR